MSKTRFKGTRRWVCAYCARASVALAKPERCDLCGSTFRDASELEAGVTADELKKAKRSLGEEDQRRLDDGFAALDFCDLRDLCHLSLREVEARRGAIRTAVVSLREIGKLGAFGRNVVDVAIGRLEKAEKGCGAWLKKWGGS